MRRILAGILTGLLGCSPSSDEGDKPGDDTAAESGADDTAAESGSEDTSEEETAETGETADTSGDSGASDTAGEDTGAPPGACGVTPTSFDYQDYAVDPSSTCDPDRTLLLLALYGYKDGWEITKAAEDGFWMRYAGISIEAWCATDASCAFECEPVGDWVDLDFLYITADMTYSLTTAGTVTDPRAPAGAHRLEVGCTGDEDECDEFEAYIGMELPCTALLTWAAEPM